MMEVNVIAAISCFVAIKGLDLLDLLPDRGCQEAFIVVNNVEIVRVCDGI